LKDVIIIFWTTNSIDEAEEICSGLIQHRLAACCSIIPKVLSVYFWENSVQKEEEIKVMIKTKKKNFSSIQKYIEKHASYEVPEILAVSISQGSLSYLKWMESVITVS